MALILKKETVKLGGSVKLGSDEPSRSQLRPAGSPSPCVQAQAKVIESNEQYAVIELTCSCGTKSYIQCDYQ